ncbi:MAG: hypothetical protein PUF61_12630 [Spirochaetales bacterium]|nr:hypothetical protein [Spirochaetales bacterium]
MDRTKLIEAQIRNTRLRFCKKWCDNGIEISIDDFLDPKIIGEAYVFSLIDTFNTQKKGIVCPLNSGLEEFKEQINKNIHKDMEYLFFEEKSSEIGAIKISGNVILNNIDFVIKESGLYHGWNDIFICSSDLKKGVCLWRSEYDTRIYVW